MKSKTTFALTLLLLLAFGLQQMAFAGASDKTTHYRVYQKDRLIKEFAAYGGALAYAKGVTYGRIEEIGTGRWVWDKLPRYKIYQFGATDPKWEFRTLNEAIAKAKTMRNVSIRDLENIGWVWSNYAQYRLYQGDNTQPAWEFADLQSAVKEAKKWTNSHIVDLKTNRWVWDNIAAAAKKKLRAGTVVYQVNQNGATADDWKYAFLEDAVGRAVSLGNAIIVRIDTRRTVYANMRQHEVFSQGKLVKAFVSMNDAVQFAKSLPSAQVKRGEQEIWTNIPYLQVYENDRLVARFHALKSALAYGAAHKNVLVVTHDNRKVWNNFRKLIYMGWNGSSNDATIQSQVAQTQGLDIDSPTWFELKDAAGGITDRSNPATAALLMSQGFKVYPLVSNTFNSELTSKFLSDPAAQRSFIDALVARLKALGVGGVNIDFEEVAGKDRDRYSEFIRLLSEAAHKQKLTVSIDLPRGDVRWNARSAYDHEKLAQYVDYIITMTYDQHWKGSESPGSVAGLQWVETGVTDFLSYGVPRDKLLLGVPFYVREWKLDSAGQMVSNRAVTMSSLADLIASTGATKTWDAAFGQYRVDYSKDGFRYVLWLEDNASVKRRIALAKKYDLAGVAFWRLGYEAPDTWSMLLGEK